MKTPKQPKDKPAKQAAGEEAKSASTTASKLDLRSDSDQTFQLILEFSKYACSKRITDKNEIKIKEVLIAITPELNKHIPGWSDLTEATMNKGNPLFRAVY